jgi:hypothetical protein
MILSRGALPKRTIRADERNERSSPTPEPRREAQQQLRAAYRIGRGLRSHRSFPRAPRCAS